MSFAGIGWCLPRASAGAAAKFANSTVTSSQKSRAISNRPALALKPPNRAIVKMNVNTVPFRRRTSRGFSTGCPDAASRMTDQCGFEQTRFEQSRRLIAACDLQIVRFWDFRFGIRSGGVTGRVVFDMIFLNIRH